MASVGNANGKSQKISPFLWFDNQAEEAANFYVSVFKNSRIGTVSRYGEEGPGQAGTVMVVPFQLEGQDFLALNGGPTFKITPAISFVVDCKTQQEVDYFWDELSEGGETLECGWLTDKFGVSWQIVPSVMTEYLRDQDREKVSSVMKAMLQMEKLDIEKLQQAYNRG